MDLDNSRYIEGIEVMAFRTALFATAVFFAMTLVGIVFEWVFYKFLDFSNLFESYQPPKPPFMWEAMFAKYMCCTIGFAIVHLFSTRWTKIASRGASVNVSVLAAIATIILVRPWHIRQAVETADLQLEVKGAALFILVGGVAGVLSASVVAIYAKINRTEKH